MHKDKILDVNIWTAKPQEEPRMVNNFLDVRSISYESECPDFIYNKTKCISSPEDQEKEAKNLIKSILDEYFNRNNYHGDSYFFLESISQDEINLPSTYGTMGKFYYALTESNTLKIFTIFTYKFKKITIISCQMFPDKLLNYQEIYTREKIRQINKIKKNT
jgi:hypothetical protein